ncbi:class I SAM-dependent methyltransferase [Deinococcus yavapaiensis]|uniref:Trans-aconitate methyltransferase n=1 Tax=Deinococcus yavapaiensis KR-236 TaxID=694435 RepID=A0A318SBJ7_9DEIO|nr:class I SAM-dependent methyltransferase [Deinococcus yavapaiensis]PYE56418.1 trans-aconitate methyltransferase [Deinococcus yavapaiensis KR-236]
MTTWNSDLYRDRHAFVWQHGGGVLTWLDAQPGERIVDLGCGTGELTVKIAEAGASVLGIDASSEMIEAASTKFPSLTWKVADARTFEVEPHDAIFSNAALHWVKPPEAVVERVAASLRRGGRFVAEFGGRGNVAGIVEATSEARRRLGLADVPAPWYFPSVGEYASLLESFGLVVRRAESFERPTRLEGEDGLRAWLTMFGGGLLAKLDDSEREAVVVEAERIARATLWQSGEWVADYVRLRVLAVRA